MIVRYIFLQLISLIILTEAFSQREDYNWLLGSCNPLSDSTWSRIHWIFNDQDVYLEKREYKVDHKMQYTNSSISNKNGQLLFYTNGLSIFNRKYEPMPNGDGLNPGKYANSNKDYGYDLEGGAIILPWPGHPGKYFVFHLTTDNIPFVWYSLDLFTTLVDMSLDNGLGDVVYKNKSVHHDSLVNGSLSACRHANGRDWWIPCFYYSGRKCLMFLLDPGGVKLHHIQSIPFHFEPSGNGQAQFSPDGSKYSFFHRNSASYREFFLADFDRCNGRFSNPEYHTVNKFELVGVGFSPNSNFLYMATAAELYQMDLTEPNPFENRLRIDSIDGFESFPLFPSYFSFMQLAPDGKIYINNGRSPDRISTINKPDLKGKACEVLQHNIHITSNATLPNFPFFRLGALQNSSCDTLNKLPVADWTYIPDNTDNYKIKFSDQSNYEISEWQWDFGDLNSVSDTSSLKNPEYIFPGDGIYEVCLIVKNPSGADTLCKSINITHVSAEDIAEANARIKIWPNPSNGQITIQFPKNILIDKSFLSIQDINGKPVYTDRAILDSRKTLTLDLKPGVYFVIVNNYAGSKYYSRLVVLE